MSRREQLLGLGDSLKFGLGEKVLSKKAEDSPTYWPAVAQTTKLPDQLGYLIKHADGKLEVHSSMAWRLNNPDPNPLPLWDDSFANNRFVINVGPSAQGLETWYQLRAQNESMSHLAEKISGKPERVLGSLAQDIQSTLHADMIAASQAQFRLARRRALADKFQSDYTKACNAQTTSENSRKVYGLDDALAYIEKMITPRQDAFHAQGVGQIMSGTLVATNDFGLIVLAKRQGS